MRMGSTWREVFFLSLLHISHMATKAKIQPSNADLVARILDRMSTIPNLKRRVNDFEASLNKINEGTLQNLLKQKTPRALFVQRIYKELTRRPIFTFEKPKPRLQDTTQPGYYNRIYKPRVQKKIDKKIKEQEIRRRIRIIENRKLQAKKLELLDYIRTYVGFYPFTGSNVTYRTRHPVVGVYGMTMVDSVPIRANNKFKSQLEEDVESMLENDINKLLNVARNRKPHAVEELNTAKMHLLMRHQLAHAPPNNQFLRGLKNLIRTHKLHEMPNLDTWRTLVNSTQPTQRAIADGYGANRSANSPNRSPNRRGPNKGPNKGIGSVAY